MLFVRVAGQILDKIIYFEVVAFSIKTFERNVLLNRVCWNNERVSEIE